MFWSRSFRPFKELHFLESITSKLFKQWSWTSFSKCAKYYVYFKDTRKLWENVFGFEDNGVWTCCRNLSQLWAEYMWLAVNLLPNNPNISDLTKKDVFQPNLCQINRNAGLKCRRADFVSVWDLWTRWFAKGVLKEELSVIQITTFFRINNLQSV